MMHKCLLIVGLLMLTVFAAMAQKPDTTSEKKTTEVLYHQTDSAQSQRFKPKVKREKLYRPDSTHSPHSAVMRSLIFPGLGQAYNRKYWKMPLVYAGLGGIMLAILFNAKYYNDFLTVAKLQNQGATLTTLAKDTASSGGRRNYRLFEAYGSVSSAAIINAKDAYRRNRDISILGFAAGWGIQMVDAYIDAKFIHSYSMDNNLSIKVTPSIMGQPPTIYASNFNTTFAPSLKITLTLR